MTETETLIARIHSTALRVNRSPSTISAKVLGGGRVLADLEAGRTITLAKYENAMAALTAMETSDGINVL